MTKLWLNLLLLLLAISSCTKTPPPTDSVNTAMNGGEECSLDTHDL